MMDLFSELELCFLAMRRIMVAKKDGYSYQVEMSLRHNLYSSLSNNRVEGCGCRMFSNFHFYGNFHSFCYSGTNNQTVCKYTNRRKFQFRTRNRPNYQQFNITPLDKFRFFYSPLRNVGTWVDIALVRDRRKGICWWCQVQLAVHGDFAVKQVSVENSFRFC